MIRVIPVSAVYAAAAFVILDVINNNAEPLNFPGCVSRWVIAILLSWILVITL